MAWFTYTLILTALQDLIDFFKDTGLQSSAAATWNGTIKVLGALHKFIGPGDDWCLALLYLGLSIHLRFMIEHSMNFLFTDIKGFLTDVKPALPSALDAEYEKNPFEVLYYNVNPLISQVDG